MRKLDEKIETTVIKNVFEAGRCTCIPTINLKICLFAKYSVHVLVCCADLAYISWYVWVPWDGGLYVARRTF